MIIYSFKINERVLDNAKPCALLFILTIIVFVFNQVNDYHYFGRSILIGALSSITVWSFLLKTQNNPMVCFFRWIGGFSLDVYVLHSFFLIGTRRLIDYDWFINMPFVIQTIVLVVGAFVLLGFSYILSKIIRSNRLLTKCLLGR